MDISIKYGSSNSKYWYPGTEVLINKLDIRDDSLLKEAEALYSAQRLLELAAEPVTGKFDLQHLQRIHHYIFQDIYPFAGLIREENISKDGTPFAQSQYIVPFATDLFNKLKSENYLETTSNEVFSNRAAYYMSEINAIHPFREGNGRATREFIRPLALYCNFKINWDSVDITELLDASIKSIKDYTHLSDCIMRCINS
ncbi:MAG: Fic/DOC family protein [Eubacteriales bacterium]